MIILVRLTEKIVAQSLKGSTDAIVVDLSSMSCHQEASAGLY